MGMEPKAPALIVPVSVSPSTVAVQVNAIGIGTFMFILAWPAKAHGYQQNRGAVLPCR